jgi:HlyD family secretion protein
MTRSRALLVLALTAVAAGAAGVFWTAFARPVEVRIAEVQRDVSIQIFGLGTVEARILSRVGFEMAGTLVSLHADNGDLVEQGALLARLDSREQEAKVAQARAAVVQGESAVHQASAAVEHADAVLSQKAHVNERRQHLVERGNVSAEVAEDAATTYDIALADLNQARSAVEVARANLEQAKALAKLEEAKLSKSALYAPYGSVVVSRNRELGSMLAPGEQLFTLLDPATIWVLAYVDETKAGQVKIGQQAEVILRSMAERRFKGEVTRIDIESDRVNEERRVYVRCVDCPPGVHIGEQAEVLITVAELPEARLVPQAAVTDRKGNRGTIWVVEDGRLAQRTVTFGRRTLDGRLEIVDGVASEAKVVAVVSPGFRTGRAVAVKSGGAP